MKLKAQTKAAIIASAEAVSAAAVVIGLCAFLETGVLTWLGCALLGALAVSALLISAIEFQRQSRALERWNGECWLADRWLAEFPDAVDALKYVREAATVGGIDISKHRELMRKRAAHERALDGALAALYAGEPLDGDAVVNRAHPAMPPDELDALARDWSREWDTPLPARGVAYKFLSAECGDAS